MRNWGVLWVPYGLLFISKVEHLLTLCISFVETASQVYCPLLILDWYLLLACRSSYTLWVLFFCLMCMFHIFSFNLSFVFKLYLWNFCSTELYICMHHGYYCSFTQKNHGLYYCFVQIISDINHFIYICSSDRENNELHFILFKLFVVPLYHQFYFRHCFSMKLYVEVL